MSTELTTTSAALLNWNDAGVQRQIKETYGKNLNAEEWKLFLGLGQATGLNPFLREIWAVKYGNNAASIFIGRDGYRRSAQNHPEYEYHFADAVYSNDVFKLTNGEVTHEYNLADRGKLIGAYCIVKRKNASRAAFNFADVKEYEQKFGVWTTKPATMIKKVAEAQGLRASFQELFAGTYEESENWQDDKRNPVEVVEVVKPEIVEQPRQAESPKSSPVVKAAAPAQFPREEGDVMLSKEQLAHIQKLWEALMDHQEVEKDKRPSLLLKTLQQKYGVKTFTYLRAKQAEHMIAGLTQALPSYEEAEDAGLKAA